MAQTLHSRMITLLCEQKGMAAIHMAMLGTVLVGMAALAVDVGHALVTQNELQNAADAAALAATGQMGVTYLAMPIGDQQNLSRDLTGAEQTAITGQAMAAAAANKASDVASLALSQADIQFGSWDFVAHTFTPTVTRPNAIRVTARRDGGQNGPITTFFAGVLGVNTMNIATTATAALGTSGGPVAPGVADVPFAISSNWFNNTANCNDGIQFSPTGPNGCAGWHVFDQTPANANKLRNTIDGLNDGSYTAPGFNPGADAWEFTGGEVSSAFPNLIDLWDAKRQWSNENGRYEWDINLPVYQASSPSSCDNPNGSIIIAGYAKATITEVQRNDIQAEVKCDAFFKGNPNPTQPGGGGGGILAPLSVFPRLVT
ncbi:MAG: TadG family pilus assembly protein [Nitrospirales bacterium]